MDKEINFSIENDALIRNVVTPMEEDNSYMIHKDPVFTKEVFIECYNRWIKGEEKSNETMA